MENQIEFNAGQLAFLGHDSRYHARLVAGPGAGKSFTCAAYLEKLSRKQPGRRARMLTFTRAATAEFERKLIDAGLGEAFIRPSTVHGFALSLLLSARAQDIPIPLRLADRWQHRNLIHAHLSLLLRRLGNVGVTARTVEKLEREMAAGWESLDRDAHLNPDITDDLRNAFAGVWQYHRRVFRYALLSELPFRAAMLVEDVGAELAIDVLLVDEYQDLNAADIRLLRALAARGITVIAIGDDDQSIYGFRHADPSGVRRFLEEFNTNFDYALVESRRCGSAIINAANALIQSDHTRAIRQPLTPAAGAPQGEYHYLRFQSDQSEAEGVAQIVVSRISSGVEPRDIVVLVRSSEPSWANFLRPALNRVGVALASTDSVDRAMDNVELRRGLAISRIVLDLEDSLSWWTLLSLEPGVGQSKIDAIYAAANQGSAFGKVLMDWHRSEYAGVSATFRSRVRPLVARVLGIAEEVDVDLAVLDERGWGGWLLDRLNPELIIEEVSDLLIAVGTSAMTLDSGLTYFLNQIEPLGRDLAANSQNAVRLMTMSQSKGLTADTAIVLGVEEGVIPMPPPKGGTEEEERRLLYVAMTRARQVCILTYAVQRHGAMAMRGEPNFGARRRSPLIAALPIGQLEDGPAFIAGLPR